MPIFFDLQAEVLKEQQAKRVKLDVVLRSPVVTVPASSMGGDFIQANLGVVTVKNALSLAEDKSGKLAIIDNMDVAMSDLSVIRYGLLHLFAFLELTHKMVLSLVPEDFLHVEGGCLNARCLLFYQFCSSRASSRPSLCKGSRNSNFSVYYTFSWLAQCLQPAKQTPRMFL